MQHSAAESCEPEVLLFTDGACSGNPGPGGWAFVLRHAPSGRTQESAGAEWETTNNRMELQAAIEGLRRLKRRTRVRIVTDSAYLKNGISLWLSNWKRHHWKRKTSSGWKPVKNQELWLELDELIQRHEVSFEWVRGHAGHPENERCDELAVAACQELKRRTP